MRIIAKNFLTVIFKMAKACEVISFMSHCGYYLWLMCAVQCIRSTLFCCHIFMNPLLHRHHRHLLVHNCFFQWFFSHWRKFF